MAQGVVLSSDQGDADDRLVTSSGAPIRDTQLSVSAKTFSWGVDGVTGLRRRVITQDGSNSFVASVSGGLLLFTSQAAGPQQREAWEIQDTIAENSEMVTYLGLPDSIGTSIAQWGNIHRLRYDAAAGLWRMYVVWTDTTIPLPSLVNHGVVTFTGGATAPINNAGQNGVPIALNVLRYLRLSRLQRASNVVTADSIGPWLPPVGATGNVVTNTDTSFHITGASITAADQTLRTVQWAQTAANATDGSAGGQFQPATKWATLPMMLGSRLVGTTLTSKLWRPEEPEPDWGDPTRTASYTFSAGDPAPHSGEGASAFWVGHLESGNAERFGLSRWRRL